MIRPAQVRTQIIRPTLKEIGMGSPAAENLLMGTAAVESRMGEFLVQLGGGPALGIFQVEPATHGDIWENYLAYRPDDRFAIRQLATLSSSSLDLPEHDELVFNLRYSCAIARLVYRRSPEPLPDADDVEALANYWKDVYNTHLGAGTVEKFVDAYHRYCEGN